MGALLHFCALPTFSVQDLIAGPVFLGVSKNNGTPKWMVYNGKPMKTLLNMDDLGVPLFLETPISGGPSGDHFSSEERDPRCGGQRR